MSISRDEREIRPPKILNFDLPSPALEASRLPPLPAPRKPSLGHDRRVVLGHEIGSRAPAMFLGSSRSSAAWDHFPPWPRVSAATLVEAMRSDKKARSGAVRFVLSPLSAKRAPTTISSASSSAFFIHAASDCGQQRLSEAPCLNLPRR
jgi:hypothetical protein